MFSTMIKSIPNCSNCHSHSHHQLVVGLAGSCHFKFEGSENVVNRIRGCLLPTECLHDFCGLGDNYNLIINIHLSEDAESGVKRQFDTLFTKSGFFMVDNNLLQLLQFLLKEFERYGHDQDIQNSLGNILLRSLNSRLSAGRVRPSRLDINLIMDYITPRLQEKIKVEDLARCVYLSPAHFYALFRQEMGISPHQFVINQRLITAQKLLEESTQSLAEIALSTGFSSQSALTNSFKQKYGITPGRFKASINNL